MKQKTQTTLDDLFDDVKKDIFANFNCHRIGIIESFDTVNQTAKVKLVDKRVLESEEGEELKEYSLLLDCPVFIAKGSNGGFTYPIVKGDTCLVLFNDRDIDNWFEDGNIQKPNTNRTHDLSDGIAIIGIKNQQNKLTDFDNSKTTMNYKNNKIEISEGEINIENSLGTIIKVDEKVEIKTALRSLKILMDALLIAIRDLTVVDNRATPTVTRITSQITFDTLNVLLTQFGELLK